jgi:hypothetical protein
MKCDDDDYRSHGAAPERRMSFMFSCARGDASPFVIPGSALAHGPGMTERGFFRFRQRIIRVLRLSEKTLGASALTHRRKFGAI